MKVTAIKPAVKTQGRYNIFVDGKYSFSLEESQLLAAGLKTGQEIDDTRLSELKDDSDFGKKYVRALELILRRPRSEKELRDYGRRKNWEPEDLERVSQKLKDKGYLDDKKFTDFWLRARGAGKPSSRRKLSLELRQKGVPNEVIEEALAGDEAPSDAEALQRVITKKRTSYPDQQKFIAYLIRQGFRYDDIKQALGT